MLSTRDKSPRRGQSEPIDENYDKAVFGSAMFAWERKKMMVEYDKNGWLPFHVACLQGDVRKMRRFLEIVDDLIDTPVMRGNNTHSGYSPLMCATYGGNMDAVIALISAGAKVDYMNEVCHDVIDVTILRQNKVLFEFFKNKYEDMQTISKLCKYLQSPDDDLSLLAANFTSQLTQPTEIFPVSPHAQEFVDCGLVKTFLKIVQSEAYFEMKKLAFDWVFNMIELESFVQTLISADTITLLVRLMKTYLNDNLDQKIFFPLSALLLRLAGEKPEKFVQNQVQSYFIEKCVRISSEETLRNLFGCLNRICSAIPRVCDEIIQGKHKEHLLKLYSRTKTKELLLELNTLIQKICSGREQNQNMVTKLGITEALIIITGRSKSFAIQDSSIETLRVIVDKNKQCQDRALELGALTILGDILKRNRQNIPAQSTCVNTMWTLVREDLYRRRLMAEVIGFDLLLDYLTQNSVELSLIALEALDILASGPKAKPEEIGSGMVLLITQCGNKNAQIASGSLRLVRRICLRPGLVPVKRNIELIRSSDGIRTLANLLSDSDEFEVSLQAAISLAHLSIANVDFEELIGLSRRELVTMIFARWNELKPEEPDLSLLGEAISALYYHKWDIIVEEDRSLLYSEFDKFFSSKMEMSVISMAYQVVIMSKLFVDKSAAECAAQGIRVLIKSLKTKLDPELQVHTCELMTRLTRKGHPGVVDALASIGTVQLLVNLMHSPDPHVSYMATISVANLTFNHCAERQILNTCRKDAHVQQMLINIQNDHILLSGHFLEEWKHYSLVGLPGHDRVTEGKRNPSTRGRSRIISAAKKYMQSVANINLDASEEEVMEKLKSGSVPVTSFATDD